MLETRIVDFRRYNGALFSLRVCIADLGMSPAAAHRQFLENESTAFKGVARWEPYRIQDLELRSLAEQINDGVNALLSHATKVLVEPIDAWSNEGNRQIEILTDVARRIQLRLDALDYLRRTRTLGATGRTRTCICDLGNRPVVTLCCSI
jgi:hypothetical protein